MGLRGRKHVESVYSLDRMYERTAALYDALAGGAVAHDAPTLAAAG